jgi:hypothetical protein
MRTTALADDLLRLDALKVVVRPWNAERRPNPAGY